MEKIQSKSRVGKRVDDIFSPKKASPQEITVNEQTKIEKTQQEMPRSKQSRGRPVEHQEEWSKITVVLMDKQIHWLDQLTSNIRLNTKAAISRAELIRALIAALEESGIDLSNITSEIEAKQKILSQLKG